MFAGFFERENYREIYAGSYLKPEIGRETPLPHVTFE